jgi:recombination protein RecT
MARLALSASAPPRAGECAPHTIAASIMTAAQLGLEPNVNGQGYLIPYKRTCTFVPGWKGLVDLVNRSRPLHGLDRRRVRRRRLRLRAGRQPLRAHKPGDEDDPDKLVYVYAVGRIKGQDVPVIEVWTMRRSGATATVQQGGRQALQLPASRRCTPARSRCCRC